MFPLIDMKRQKFIESIKKRAYPSRSRRNELDSCSEILDKYPIYCRKYNGVIEKSLNVEEFYDPTIDSSTRFDLIRSLDWNFIETNPLEILLNIGIGEPLNSPEWVDYSETVNQFGGLDSESENRVFSYMESQLMAEIDGIRNSVDCEEVSDYIQSIGGQFDSWINESVLEYLQKQERRLQEEEESIEYPDDREYYPLHHGEDSNDYHEMFSSLYEVALNRKV